MDLQLLLSLEGTIHQGAGKQNKSEVNNNTLARIERAML